MDRAKLEEVFIQEVKTLTDASDITSEKLKALRNEIIQKRTMGFI